MDRIELWKDKKEKIIDPELYSKTAEALAKLLADECVQSGKKINKRTQVRKFFDEVIRLNMSARSPQGDWKATLPLVYMITAKAAYANGRKLVSDRFLEFIRSTVEQVHEPPDLNVFASFFEAFMGFYRLHCPAN